jgi:hypothetical protein
MNQELPQCLEEATVPCESPIGRELTEMNKEQREARRSIEILKGWEIRIQPLDRGCIVSVGCKSFAFESFDVAMETVKQYGDNPVATIKRFGFEDHI